MKHKTLIHHPGLRGPVVHKTAEELAAEQEGNRRRADPPKRITRSRAKGWRKPEGAVYVGRGTIWGNPWTAERGVTGDLRRVVRLYHEHIRSQPLMVLKAKKELAGKDLMCWCQQWAPCHAGVLLHIANTPVDCEDFPIGLDLWKLKAKRWKELTWTVMSWNACSDDMREWEVIIKAKEREEYVQASPAKLLEMIDLDYDPTLPF